MASLQGALPNMPPSSTLLHTPGAGTPSSAGAPPQPSSFSQAVPPLALNYTSALPPGNSYSLTLSRLLPDHLFS